MKQIFFPLFIIFSFSCHLKKEGIDLSSISTLPSFKILLMDSSTIFKAGEIPNGKSIIMLYFRPDCTHCQKETKLLLGNIQAFKNVQIYLLGGAPFEDVKKYYQTYHLDQYKNITVGKDYEYSFAKIFQPITIPYTVIYDAKKRLVKLYHGEVGIANLLAAIHS